MATSYLPQCRELGVDEASVVSLGTSTLTGDGCDLILTRLLGTSDLPLDTCQELSPLVCGERLRLSGLVPDVSHTNTNERWLESEVAGRGLLSEPGDRIPRLCCELTGELVEVELALLLCPLGEDLCLLHATVRKPLALGEGRYKGGVEGLGGDGCAQVFELTLPSFLSLTGTTLCLSDR